MKKILSFILFALLLLPLEGQIGRYPFYRTTSQEPYLAILNDGNHYWFKGDAGITLDEADSVVTWVSQAKPLTLGIRTGYPKNKPIQSGDSIIFNGSTNLLYNNTALSQPIMVYMVVNQLSWTDDDCFLGGSLSYFKQDKTTPNMRLYSGASSSEINGPAIGTKAIIRLLFKENAGFIKVNDVTSWTGDPGANGWDAIVIGNNVAATMTHCINAAFWEIIIGPENTEADETIIMNYLKEKHGL